MLNLFCGNKKYKKRLFLITDGEKADVTKNFGRNHEMVELMQEKDIRLNVITLDFANELGQDESDDEENEICEDAPKKKPSEAVVVAETETQTENKEDLIDLVSRIKGAIFPASVAMEVCKQFKKREVMSRARYRGTFDLAEDLKLGV